MTLMLNSPGQDVGEPEVTPESTQRSGLLTVLSQLLLIALAGLYLAGMVWLYTLLPWLALIATAVAVGIILSGFFSRVRTPPPDC